jgi:Restriction endonuclease
MNWKEYENRVLQYFKVRFPEAIITKNAKLLGGLSGTPRDIDILIESQIFGHSLQIAIECKNWNRKLDVANVGSFLDKLKDVGITKGAIISRLGYSESAYQRARNEIGVQLQVLDFENMPDSYGFWGYPYRGNFGAIISAPSGWVVDSEVSSELLKVMLCSIHPFEYTRAESQRKQQYMYFQIYPILDDHNLEKTFKEQDKIVKQKDPTSLIKYWNEIVNQRKVMYREIQSSNNNYTEFTAGVEMDDFFVYCVCIAPLKFLPDELARLRYIMSDLELIKLINIDPTDSHESWSRLFNDI